MVECYEWVDSNMPLQLENWWISFKVSPVCSILQLFATFWNFCGHTLANFSVQFTKEHLHSTIYNVLTSFQLFNSVHLRAPISPHHLQNHRDNHRINHEMHWERYQHHRDHHCSHLVLPTVECNDSPFAMLHWTLFSVRWTLRYIAHCNVNSP